MRLIEFLRPERILTPLVAGGRDEVFDAIGAFVGSLEPGTDAADVARRLRLREEEHNTVLRDGIAIPHARVDSLVEPILLLGIAPVPIHFGPEGADPVDVFFVLLSPRGGQRQHIKMLARICRIAHDPTFGEAIRCRGTAAEVFEAIRAVDERHV